MLVGYFFRKIGGRQYFDDLLSGREKQRQKKEGYKRGLFLEKKGKA